MTDNPSVHPDDTAGPPPPPAWEPPPSPYPTYPYEAAAPVAEVSPQPWTPGGPEDGHPPARTRRRGAIAAALAGIFAVGLLVGGGVARLTSSSSGATATLLTPTTTASSSSTGSASTNGGAGSSGSSSPSSVAAAVIPGVVDVNVTQSGGGTAAGTGMVITSSGEVLTNNHVIADETSITVQIAGTGPTYKAHVVGYDVTGDIALLQIEGAPHLTTVKIGSSANLTVGETVVALGNALGQSGTPAVTSGSITALGQTITASDQGGAGAEVLSGLIQTDAQLQPGDSGGPLVDSSGAVIGIDTAAQVSGSRFDQQASGVAFAIPIDQAMAIVKQIESGRSTSTVHIGQTRALLGIATQDSQSGAQVTTVQTGSPAAAAGLAAGDVITALGGTAINSQAALRNAIVAHQPADRVTVTWIDTSGQTHTATATLGTGPPA